MSAKKLTPGRSKFTGIRPGFPVIGDAIEVASATGNRKARQAMAKIVRKRKTNQSEESK